MCWTGSLGGVTISEWQEWQQGYLFLSRQVPSLPVSIPCRGQCDRIESDSIEPSVIHFERGRGEGGDVGEDIDVNWSSQCPEEQWNGSLALKTKSLHHLPHLYLPAMISMTMELSGSGALLIAALYFLSFPRFRISGFWNHLIYTIYSSHT